jgi:tetratricopeptide (TPR) repeat protein
VLMRPWSREEVYCIAERGYQLYREGRLADAVILFQGLIAIDPENAYCRKALAAISIRLGRRELALHHLSSVIERDRVDADAIARRCEVWIMTGDLDAAQRDLDSLAALPGSAERAGRLRLQLMERLESKAAVATPQLPSGPPR